MKGIRKFVFFILLFVLLPQISFAQPEWKINRAKGTGDTPMMRGTHGTEKY
jgi:hypothetical protein